MPFWSDVSAQVPEPKRNFRWLLYLGGIPTWICKKVSKPSFSITEINHDYLNHKFYYPGRLEWQTIDVTLVDPVTPDATATIYNIIRWSGWSPPEDAFDTLTINKSDAVSALGRVRIDQIGTQGTVVPSVLGSPPEAQTHDPVESWILYNCWIKDVKWGELDYTSDDLTEITLTLRYDFAKLNNDNVSVSGMPAPEIIGAAGTTAAPGTPEGLGADDA